MTTHAEHAAKAGSAVPCAAWHVNFGGGCLNCGWEPEPEAPDWAQARADQGLCAMVNDWCITHAVPDDPGHWYAVRYAANPRHDFGD